MHNSKPDWESQGRIFLFQVHVIPNLIGNRKDCVISRAILFVILSRRRRISAERRSFGHRPQYDRKRSFGHRPQYDRKKSFGHCPQDDAIFSPSLQRRGSLDEVFTSHLYPYLFLWKNLAKSLCSTKCEIGRPCGQVSGFSQVRQLRIISCI